MDSWCLGKFLGKKRMREEKISILLEPFNCPINACTSEQFRDIKGVLSLFRCCKTVVLLPEDFTEYIYHIVNAFEMHSLIKWTLSKSTKGRIRWTFNLIKEKLNTIWTNPESHRSNILGKFTAIHFFGAIWSLLRERDCNSIKHDHTQLLFQAHCQRFA